MEEKNKKTISLEELFSEYGFEGMTEEELDKMFSQTIFSRVWTWIENKIYALYKRIQWGFQRMFRGWDDRAVYTMDTYLAERIPIWIKELMKSPGCSFADEIGNAVIEGFENYLKLDEMDYNSKEYKDAERKFEIGMKVFADNYDEFWD